jgi:hypothetical protein
MVLHGHIDLKIGYTVSLLEQIGTGLAANLMKCYQAAGLVRNRLGHTALV